MHRILGVLMIAAAVFVGGCSDDDGGSSATCEGTCPDVVAANCSAGPPTLNDCVSGCDTIRNSNCATQLQAVLDCAVDSSYTCDASGNPVAVGCDDQHDALNTCLALP